LPVDEDEFDLALRESNLPTLISRLESAGAGAGPSLEKAQSPSRLPPRPSAGSPAPVAKATGVKPKRKPRPKGAVSPAELVAVVERGVDEASDAHASLTNAGFVRDLGSEVDG
jgi:hypothetical protein